jgi:putative membrane protein
VITMMWFGGGMMMLFWVAVICGVVALIRNTGWGGQRWGGQRGGESPEPAVPERLLAERFARGDIDEEEYLQRLATLQAAGHTQVPADDVQARPPAGTGTR